MNEHLADVIRPGTGRGLDFVILKELRKRTSITTEDILKFAMSEMLCNSLDTDATEIHIDIQIDGDFDAVTVRDNGTRVFTQADLKSILDFSNKASSKRGFHRVSRGYLGNALKCSFGYSYALAEDASLTPPSNLTISHGTQYEIALVPDRVKDTIGFNMKVSDKPDSDYNQFTIKFPIYRHPHLSYVEGDDSESENVEWEQDVLYDIIFATSMVNPKRRISFDLWGKTGAMGEPEEGTMIRNDTSVLWYDEKQFTELFRDYIRATPEEPLKNIMSLFRGFTGKKVQREILHSLNGFDNDDCNVGDHVQFLPATKLRDIPDATIKQLYLHMFSSSKPISKRSVPKVLGCVGEERLEQVKQEHGWLRLRYTIQKGRKKNGYSMEKESFPFLVELAVFDRDTNDTDGLKIYQCVNFMASMEDIFSRLFNISRRLAQVGIDEKMPVTVLAHLVCPVLKWLNYGKSGLYE